jgi:hypothetical protein
MKKRGSLLLLVSMVVVAFLGAIQVGYGKGKPDAVVKPTLVSKKVALWDIVKMEADKTCYKVPAPGESDFSFSFTVELRAAPKTSPPGTLVIDAFYKTCTHESGTKPPLNVTAVGSGRIVWDGTELKVTKVSSHSIKLFFPYYYVSHRCDGTTPVIIKLTAHTMKGPARSPTEAGKDTEIIKMPPCPVTFMEDCVSFNPDTTTVQKSRGDWKILDGGHSLFSFGTKEGEARQALDIIKHYGMNQSCFVGRPHPSFQYLLISGRAPSGGVAGEECIAFNPGTIAVKEIGSTWKIVDGSHCLFDFGHEESEARKAFAIIKHYGFRYSCFVGGPHAKFKYLRK